MAINCQVWLLSPDKKIIIDLSTSQLKSFNNLYNKIQYNANFFDIHKQKGGFYHQMSKKQYFNMERGPPETMGLMPGGQILYLLVCTSNSHTS